MGIGWFLDYFCLRYSLFFDFELYLLQKRLGNRMGRNLAEGVSRWKAIKILGDSKGKRLSLPMKVSEVELSRRLNCDESFIEDVEKGLRSTHPKMINPLCKELGAFPEEIVVGS